MSPSPPKDYKNKENRDKDKYHRNQRDRDYKHRSRSPRRSPIRHRSRSPRKSRSPLRHRSPRRSRSPIKTKIDEFGRSVSKYERSRSRSLEYERKKLLKRNNKRSKSRSKSPNKYNRYNKDIIEEENITLDSIPIDKEISEEEMMKLMGFSGFDSTKGKFVNDDASHMCFMSVKKEKRQYRQLMSRKGGHGTVRPTYDATGGA